MATCSILLKKITYAIFLIFWLFHYRHVRIINNIVQKAESNICSQFSPACSRIKLLISFFLASPTGTPLSIWAGDIMQLWPFLVIIWGMFKKFLKFGSAWTLTLLTGPLVIKKTFVILYLYRQRFFKNSVNDWFEIHHIRAQWGNFYSFLQTKNIIILFWGVNSPHFLQFFLPCDWVFQTLGHTAEMYALELEREAQFAWLVHVLLASNSPYKLRHCFDHHKHQTPSGQCQYHPCLYCRACETQRWSKMSYSFCSHFHSMYRYKHCLCLEIHFCYFPQHKSCKCIVVDCNMPAGLEP